MLCCIPKSIIATTITIHRDHQDLAIVKARRLEIRQYRPSPSSSSDPSPDDANASSSSSSSFPLLLSVPVNGRLTTLLPFRPPAATSDYLFFTTDRKQFGIISYDATPGGISSASLDSPYRILNHAWGPLADYGASVLGREAEAGASPCICTMDSSRSCR